MNVPVWHADKFFQLEASEPGKGWPTNLEEADSQSPPPCVVDPLPLSNGENNQLRKLYNLDPCPSVEMNSSDNSRSWFYLAMAVWQYWSCVQKNQVALGKVH